MDHVTHLISGGLVSRLSKAQNISSSFLWLCLVSSVAPDIDFLVGILGPEATLLHHRGVTHSAMGGLFIALFVTWVFWIRRKPFRFWAGFGVSFFLISLHIFLDLTTSYGTQILAPFSHHRFTLNSVFIIDPIMTLSALAFLIVSIVLKKHSKRIAFAGVVFLLVYPLVNTTVNQLLKWQLKKELHLHGVQFQRVDLLPEPLSPFYWKVILTNSSEYSVCFVDIFQPWRSLKFTRFDRAITPLVKNAVQESSMFRTYMWFAAYPVIKTESTTNGTVITLTDLRFKTHLFGNRRDPFKLMGYFNKQLKLTRWEYLCPFREHVIRILE